MKRLIRTSLAVWLMLLPVAAICAEDADSEGKYAETIAVFKNAGESGRFFDNSHGYAVFPSIGKAGLGIGGAYGKGRVYADGKHVGDTSVTQAKGGLMYEASIGGQKFSYTPRQDPAR